MKSASGPEVPVATVTSPEDDIEILKSQRLFQNVWGGVLGGFWHLELKNINK